MTFYIFHRHRACLVDHVDLVCSLYSWWKGFGSSSLAILPLGFNCGFISTSTCGVVHWGLLLRLPWRTWVCPCEGQVWRWCSCLGRRGSGSTRYKRELAAGAAGNIVLQKGMASSIGQYTPVFLPREPHSLKSLVGHSLQGHIESHTTEMTLRAQMQDFFFFFFGYSSSAPVWVESEGGAATSVTETLVAPSVQGHRLPQPLELQPQKSLF